MAGAGMGDRPGAAAYNVLAPVMPYRHGQTRDDPGAGVFYRPDTLTVVSVPEPAAPARESHTYYLKPDVATGAYRLMHYDGEVTDSPVVDNVVALAFEYFGDPRPPTLTTGDNPGHAVGPRTTYGAAPPGLDLDADPQDEYGPGENCVFAVSEGRQVSRLAQLGGNEGDVRLEPAVLSDGPWCPAWASPDRYDADLLRVRRIRIAIRLQAAAPFRGPAGVLFSRGGTATTAPRRVPDRGVTFDIAPRNMPPSGGT